MNEWENDDSDKLQPLYSGYKAILILNLFKQRYTKSVKSYKYLCKFIRILGKFPPINPPPLPGKSPPRKFPPEIFPPISLIVFLHLTLSP